MSVRVEVPPLGGRVNNAFDARLTGVACVIFGVVALAMDIAPAHRTSENAAGALLVSMGLRLVLLPGSAAGWERSLTTGVQSLILAGVAATNAGTLSTATTLTYIVGGLQMSNLRSRAEAWWQFGWSMTAYGVAVSWTRGWPGGLWPLLMLSAVLALLTTTGTWFRAGLDLSMADLNRRADHDSLTGLLNRQGLTRSPHGGLGRDPGGSTAEDAFPRPTGGAALLIDIDHFKVINDTFGHPYGDEVLVWLGGLLAGFVRPPARVSRWGGEEFLLVIPGLNLAAAVERGEHLRTLVATASSSLQHPLTISVGVAAGMILPGPDGLQALYVRADSAMYQAKQRGRNRVEFAEEPPVIVPAA